MSRDGRLVSQTNRDWVRNGGAGEINDVVGGIDATDAQLGHVPSLEQIQFDVARWIRIPCCSAWVAAGRTQVLPGLADGIGRRVLKTIEAFVLARTGLQRTIGFRRTDVHRGGDAIVGSDHSGAAAQARAQASLAVVPQLFEVRGSRWQRRAPDVVTLGYPVRYLH